MPFGQPLRCANREGVVWVRLHDDTEVYLRVDLWTQDVMVGTIMTEHFTPAGPDGSSFQISLTPEDVKDFRLQEATLGLSVEVGRILTLRSYRWKVWKAVWAIEGGAPWNN